MGEDGCADLGKGSFGSCTRMTYKDIEVAVKTYKSDVKKSDVIWEASVINMLDHPGK